MGAILGLLLGALGAIPSFGAGEYGEAVKDILTLSVSMAAVLVVLPKIVAILMEGLIPISEGAREYLQKRFPGRDVLIGLDAAVVIGHPANMAVALLCVPIALLLAVVLPGNRMLPFGDLAALPFYVLWGVAASRGNMVRGLLNAVVILCCILWIGTSLAPLTTELARAAHFAPEGLGGEAGALPRVVGGRAREPRGPLDRPPALPHRSRRSSSASPRPSRYGGVWWWVRGEIRAQFAEQIAAKAGARSRRERGRRESESVKLVLPDALHARPANLLVRLAAQHAADGRLRKGACRADARKILDVLSLGAAKGEEIEVVAEGDGRRDVARRGDRRARGAKLRRRPGPRDAGAARVEGIAIGRALVVTARARSDAPRDAAAG